MISIQAVFFLLSDGQGLTVVFVISALVVYGICRGEKGTEAAQQRLDCVCPACGSFRTAGREDQTECEYCGHSYD